MFASRHFLPIVRQPRICIPLAEKKKFVSYILYKCLFVRLPALKGLCNSGVQHTQIALIPASALSFISKLRIRWLIAYIPSLGKISLGRPKRRWQDNGRMNLEEIGINARNRIDSTQDRNYWKVIMNVTLNLRIL